MSDLPAQSHAISRLKLRLGEKLSDRGAGGRRAALANRRVRPMEQEVAEDTSAESTASFDTGPGAEHNAPMDTRKDHGECLFRGCAQEATSSSGWCGLHGEFYRKMMLVMGSIYWRKAVLANEDLEPGLRKELDDEIGRLRARFAYGGLASEVAALEARM